MYPRAFDFDCVGGFPLFHYFLSEHQNFIASATVDSHSDRLLPGKNAVSYRRTSKPIASQTRKIPLFNNPHHRYNGFDVFGFRRNMSNGCTQATLYGANSSKRCKSLACVSCARETRTTACRCPSTISERVSAGHFDNLPGEHFCLFAC